MAVWRRGEGVTMRVTCMEQYSCMVSCMVFLLYSTKWRAVWQAVWNSAVFRCISLYQTRIVSMMGWWWVGARDTVYRNRIRGGLVRIMGCTI